MLSKKPLKTFLFPAANILIAIILLRAFFIAGMTVVETFPCGRLSAIKFLKPQPMSYLWDVNINNAPMDISRIRFYKDYFEHLLYTFPSLTDAYGVLGYCYFYLGDEAKAIDYFKKAIAYNPSYTWNYYDLAAIYFYQARYQEASVLLQEMESLDPKTSLDRTLASQDVYAPLLGVTPREALGPLAKHLKLCYRVGFDLIQVLNRMSTDAKMNDIVKKTKLELYVF